MNSYFLTLIHIKYLKWVELIFVCDTHQQYKKIVLSNSWALAADIVSEIRE
jgi:hypothetical protein